MGLFGKKKEQTEERVYEKSEELVLKEALETEVEKLQKEFRIKQEEIESITKKLQSVKEEYDVATSNLMSVKKESNQKKMELDTIYLEYKDIKSKITNADQIFNKNKKSIEERLWEKVKKQDGCWLWTGSTNEDGYGKIYASGGNGQKEKKVSVHRVAWESINGKITDGMSVLHQCDNPPCCNPNHLFLGTQADNIHDMYAKGRNRNIGPLGEAAPSAKLTADQVREIRSRKSSLALAKEFGISYRHLRQLFTGVRWKHIL